MAKKWRDLVAPLHADPVRHATIERMTQAMADVHQLAAVSESRGLPQPGVFRIKHEPDAYLSTLANYLAAIGGRLEIRAVLPDERIELSFPESSDDNACEDDDRGQ
jgi:hypothetical protein